jgi:PAS domain S-box-containing protein
MKSSASLKRTILGFGCAAILAPAAVFCTSFFPAFRSIPWTLSYLVIALVAEIGGVFPALLSGVISLCGVYFLVLTSRQAHFDDANAWVQVCAFLVTATVITYLVRLRSLATSSLQISEEHYRSVTETASDVVITIDEHSRILSINPSVKVVFGYEPEELIGKQMVTLMPERLRAPHLAGIARHLDTGERHIPWTGIQLPGLRRDGQEISLEISFASHASNGRWRFTGFIRDISERQKRDEALRQSAKRLGELASIVDSSEDVILSKDLNGIVRSWNAAAGRLFGYSAEEMIGSSILKLIPEHLHSDEKTILENIRSGRRIEHFETIRITKDGRLLEVSLTISPIKDEQGQVIGASKILRDISSRKRIEQALLQAEKIAATGRMAATIAHEINNPLEAVMNLLYLLRSRITDEQAIAYLTTAEGELGRVSHIAKQTLGYYREHASASSASLSEIAQHAVSIYEPRCTAVGIQIRSAFRSSRKVVLRRGEMMQVISNLIANSIYAMPAGGLLTISLKDSDDGREGIVLCVHDDGEGISEEDLPKVFDAFFTTRSTVGTGIGLFVAKQFVEGHGGEITIESISRTEHHGTSVYIFLPIRTLYEPNIVN